MYSTKRVAGVLGVVAGVALIAFTGPAALADEVTTAPSQNPCDTVDLDATVSTVAAVQSVVSADKPENPGSNGNGSDKGDKDRDRTKDQDCDQTQTQDKAQDRDQVRDQTKDQTRAELRDQIRLNGGSWGAYQRQDALINVATKLAERYGATPENTNAASLGRILTLINSGLPEALQIDVQMFLAQYELSLSDVTWPDGTEPEPSPAPSE